MAGSMRTRKPRAKKDQGPPTTGTGEPDAGPPPVEGEQASKAAVDQIGKKQAAARGSNVTDETIRDFCVRARVAHTELDRTRKEMQSTNGVYRQILKDAKKAGVAGEDIIWYIAAVERDPAEIDAETKRRNRLAQVMGLPIGTQLGMFDDGTTVATAVDQAKLPKVKNGGAPVEEAGLTPEMGYVAGKAGKPAADNPHPEGSPSHDLWASGWTRGQAENVAGLTSH